MAERNNISSLDLVPELAALKESTQYECEMRSQCAEKTENLNSLEFSRWVNTLPINHMVKNLRTNEVQKSFKPYECAPPINKPFETSSLIQCLICSPMCLLRINKKCQKMWLVHIKQSIVIY